MSPEAIRRSLTTLVAGKVLSVLLGLLVLGLMWRRVPPTVYGQWLTVLALVELTYLCSGAGLSTVAQRYLPEWIEARRQAGRAWVVVAHLMSLRLALALSLAGLLGLAWPAVAPGLDLPIQAGTLAAVLACVGVGSLQRCTEEVHTALMMQGWAQAMGSLMQAIRLPALMTLPATPGPLNGVASLNGLLLLELVAGTVAVVLGLAAVVHRMRPSAPSTLLDSSASHRPAQAPSWGPAWRVGLRFWGVQLLGLGLSTAAVRLLLSHVAGSLAVAVYGAVQSLADALRNALPMVWMTGWLRGTLLRQHLQQPHNHRPLDLALGVQRLSVLLLWPWMAVLACDAATWWRLAVGGPLAEQARELGAAHPLLPDLSLLLVAAVAVVDLQTRHLVLSLWSVTTQRATPALLASAFAAGVVMSLPLLWPLLGLWAVPLVLAVAEAAWIAVASRGLGLGLPIGPNPLPLLLGLGVAAVAVQAWAVWPTPPSWLPWATVMPLLASAAGVWAGARLWRPLQPAQGQALSGWLPGWTWRPWCRQPTGPSAMAHAS